MTFNCRAKHLEAPLAFAVSVAACAELTDEAVAVKVALVAPCKTVAVAGRVTAELLLDRVTICPPAGAGPVSVTVQASVPAPVMEALVQESALTSGKPAPVKLTIADGLMEELLVRVSWPVAAPAVVGVNCTLNVRAMLGLRVTGNVAPDMVKPDPARDAALMVTGAAPVDVRVTGCDAVVFTGRMPKSRLLVLMPSDDIAAFNCRAKHLETPFALAVSVAVCAVLTDAAVAVNTALVAPDATVTAAGSVTAALLLERFTINPPLGAAAFSVTVQTSVPDPVREALVQETALTTGMPVPLRLIAEMGLVEELLEMVSCPTADPEAAGLNCTPSVTAWAGFNVTGNVAPDTVKPVPVSAAELMVSGVLPVDVRVTD